MTKVTDKMVEAACDAFGCDQDIVAMKLMRTAIEAALAAREPVYAREWVKHLRAVAEFSAWTLQETVFNGCSVDGVEVQKKALELGLFDSDELEEALEEERHRCPAVLSDEQDGTA